MELESVLSKPRKKKYMNIICLRLRYFWEVRSLRHIAARHLYLIKMAVLLEVKF